MKRKNQSSHIFTTKQPVTAVDAEETKIGAHAILVTPEGKLILQQREDKPSIVNPGLISMFGGTLKSGESVTEGLYRELEEELELDIVLITVNALGEYNKTKGLDGIDFKIYVFVISGVKPEELRLCEGKGFVCDFPNVLVSNPKLTRITKLAIKDFLKTHQTP